MYFLLTLFFLINIFFASSHDIENKFYFTCKGTVLDILNNREEKNQEKALSYDEVNNFIDFDGKRFSGNRGYFYPSGKIIDEDLYYLDECFNKNLELNCNSIYLDKEKNTHTNFELTLNKVTGEIYIHDYYKRDGKNKRDEVFEGKCIKVKKLF